MALFCKERRSLSILLLICYMAGAVFFLSACTMNTVGYRPHIAQQLKDSIPPHIYASYKRKSDDLTKELSSSE